MTILTCEQEGSERNSKEEIMDLFLKKILITDKVICDNINKKDALGIELLSQNIVAQLRNFVEAIARFLCRQ